MFLSRHNDFFTLYFPISLYLFPSGRHLQFPDLFWQSYRWIITKLGMWVGNATLLYTIKCRSGRMNTLRAPLTFMAKNARNRGFQTFSDRVLYGSSRNLVCGLVLPPYSALLNAVAVGLDAHESRTIDFGGYKRLKQRFPHHFWQSLWGMITKLDMWVGITTILTPINDN